MKTKFNIDNSYDFYDQLKANIDGRLDTWAVKWYATCFLKNGLSLHCYPSLINNIGNDGFGVNCENSTIFTWKDLAKQIKVLKISMLESYRARKEMIKYYNKYSGQIQDNYFGKIKRFIKLLILKVINRN